MKGGSPPRRSSAASAVMITHTSHVTASASNPNTHPPGSATPRAHPPLSPLPPSRLRSGSEAKSALLFSTSYYSRSVSTRKWPRISPLQKPRPRLLLPSLTVTKRLVTKRLLCAHLCYLFMTNGHAHTAEQEVALCRHRPCLLWPRLLCCSGHPSQRRSSKHLHFHASSFLLRCSSHALVPQCATTAVSSMNLIPGSTSAPPSEQTISR